MLDYYFDILKGRKRPRFHLALGQPAPVRRDDLAGAPLDELWRAHDVTLDELRACGALEDAGTAPGTGQGITPAASARPGHDGAAAAGVSLMELKVALAGRLLSSCCFCERRCYKDRAAGEIGDCGVPAESRYASEFFHFGEEPELVPSHTIFFSGCNFRCVYCQNFDIATRPLGGAIVEPRRLAEIIDRGRRQGSRNVNFVGGNPDPHLYACLRIISCLETDVPVVWNSNAYASTETMKLLDGVVDVFLSDFRYGNNDCARKYSDVPRYFQVVTRNFILADIQAEVMLRHLVLPGHLECCTRPVMEWVSANIPHVYFNLMFQYHPEHRAREFPEIDRPLTVAEMERARLLAREYGIAVV